MWKTHAFYKKCLRRDSATPRYALDATNARGTTRTRDRSMRQRVKMSTQTDERPVIAFL